MRAYPISEHKTETVQGAAIIHMIMNNLDRRVAQFPEELVTYGGNGQVSIMLSSLLRNTKVMKFGLNILHKVLCFCIV